MTTTPRLIVALLAPQVPGQGWIAEGTGALGGIMCSPP